MLLGVCQSVAGLCQSLTGANTSPAHTPCQMPWGGVLAPCRNVSRQDLGRAGETTRAGTPGDSPTPLAMETPRHLMGKDLSRLSQGRTVGLRGFCELPSGALVPTWTPGSPIVLTHITSSRRTRGAPSPQGPPCAGLVSVPPDVTRSPCSPGRDHLLGNRDMYTSNRHLA